MKAKPKPQICKVALDVTTGQCQPSFSRGEVSEVYSKSSTWARGNPVVSCFAGAPRGEAGKRNRAFVLWTKWKQGKVKPESLPALQAQHGKYWAEFESGAK